MNYDIEKNFPVKEVNSRFKKDPEINIITKEEFEDRVVKVFRLLWKSLSKSFGPYGAPTIIYNHPFSHITKDGFTIMKNLSLNASETYLDEAIANMASDICGRLNYTVGDGTTSAVIATYSIYNRYKEKSDYFTKNRILPRDIISRYNSIKDEIIESLNEKIVPVNTDDKEALRDIISKVVYISSNGDEQMTEYISDFYYELGCPGITCNISDDRTTKKRLIEGYKHDASLMDRAYINSDNDVMELSDTDVLIFTKRVTLSTYEYILKPLSNECKYRGRHLICIAPNYDEAALHGKIERELNDEKMKTKDVNLVLTNYRAISAFDKKAISDLAVLLNTSLINSEIEGKLIDEIKRGKSPVDVFNLDDRDIDNINILAYVSTDGRSGAMKILSNDEASLEEVKQYNGEIVRNKETGFRVGFVHKCTLGLKDSLFSDFVYDKDMYEAIKKDAEVDLREKEKKYSKLGTFNLEVASARKRLYSLSLKTGIIEIGAESELSQKMIKDSVDDALRASNSAYNHGVVLGCNVNLIQSIFDIREKAEKENRRLDYALLDILLRGFCDVYSTVLTNAFEDKFVSDAKEVREVFQSMTKYTIRDYKDNIDDETMNKVIDAITPEYENEDDTIPKVRLNEAIINYSILTNQVFDVSKMVFTKDVINSVETDRQILRATVDLISLLVTGNQVVVTQKHNFE